MAGYDNPNHKFNSFDIADIVLIKGHDEYMEVVGVIHDQKRLFVDCSTKQEFEVPFADVQMQFKEVKMGRKPDDKSRQVEQIAMPDNTLYGATDQRELEEQIMSASVPKTEREWWAKKRIEELQDFAIWMTGCGYDFCQHDYFCKKRDKLLKA